MTNKAQKQRVRRGREKKSLTVVSFGPAGLARTEFFPSREFVNQTADVSMGRQLVDLQRLLFIGRACSDLTGSRPAYYALTHRNARLYWTFEEYAVVRGTHLARTTANRGFHPPSCCHQCSIVH